MRATGFTGDFAAFTTMLRTEPRFFYKDSASLVRAYRDIAKRIDPGLARLFGRLPRLPYGVSTIPSYAAPSQTTAYYMQGSPDSHRLGRRSFVPRDVCVESLVQLLLCLLDCANCIELASRVAMRWKS